MPIKELEFSNLRLEVVKNFLDKNLKVIDAEQAIIREQEENNEFRDRLDDFSNAIFPSILQEEIVVRAVYYELSAIIEFIFQDFAMNSYHKSQTKHSKFIGDKEEYEIKEIKFVSKLNFKKLEEEIEKTYNFKFNDLKNYDYKKIKRIRQIAVDFKHHRGYKDPYKYPESEISDESKPSRKEVYQAIDETKSFFEVLRKKIEAV
ncbi:hypothetical protein KAK05_03735 [Candidatus Parcubacteria bacterium]|nr:hypothetical protein [Candidatus Parcubacteria bacterium]